MQNSSGMVMTPWTLSVIDSDIFTEEAADRRKKFKIRCERWLRPSALKEVHHYRLRARTKGTCYWIQHNPTFLQWRDLQASTTSERILFISGTHGCGKSILASAITEQFLTEGRRTLFFYFSSTDTSRQTADSVARSFLAQLLRQDSEDRVSGSLTGLMDDEEQTSPSDLWGALSAALWIEPQATFCVLDGLDESFEQQEVLAKVSALLEEVAHAKCVLLARPRAFEALQSPIVTKDWLLTMDSALTQQDIDAFLADEIDKIALIRATNLHNVAFDILREKSSSLFLWVRLMISDLEKACSKHELEQRLQNVPQGLEDAYRLIFSRIKQRLDDRELQRTQVILALVITARRPFRIEELMYALALWMRSNSKTTGTSLEEFLPFDSEKTILHACGDMVLISSGIIHLNHSSVRDFLCRDECQWTGPDDWQLTSFRVDLAETNGLFAALCLDYLDLENLGYPLKEPDTLMDLRRTHPFVDYASYNFFFHLQKSNAGFSSVLDKLRSITSTLHLISWIEHGAIAWTEDAFDWNWSATDDYNEDYVREWHAMMTCDEDVRKSAMTQLDAEIVLRTSRFGADDFRTAILSNILFFASIHETQPASRVEFLESVVEMLDSNQFGEAPFQIDQGSSNAIEVVPDRTYQDITTVINDAANFLKHSQLVPSRSITMLLKMWQHASRTENVREIADPLVLLFQLILKKASTLPVYVVLGICEFYSSLGKGDQVLQLCQAILPRVDGCGSRAESLTYRFMGCRYHYMQGKEAEAVKCFQRVVSIKEHFWLVENNRFWVSRVMYNPDDRCDFLEELLEQDMKRYGKQAKCTLETRLQLGRTFSQLGLEDEAMTAMRLTWETGKKRQIHDSAATFRASWQMGVWWREQRHLEEARKCFEDLCKWVGTATRKNYKWYGQAYDSLAEVMKELGRPDDSLGYSHKAYLAAKKFMSSETSYLLERMIHSLIGTIKYKQTSNRNELLLTYSALNRKNDESLRLLEVLASVLEKYYQYEEALDIGQRVLDAKMEKFPNDLSKLFRSHRFVNEILGKLGSHEEAIANRKKLAEALKQQHVEDDDEYLDELQDLANALYDLNRWEEALECWQALLKINVTEFPQDWRIIVDQICIFRMVGEFDMAREMWVSAQETGEGPFSKLSWPTSLALWEISGMISDSWKRETALSIGYVEEDKYWADQGSM